MSDEFDFFSNDCNNWNYNPFINTPNSEGGRERELPDSLSAAAMQ